MLHNTYVCHQNFAVLCGWPILVRWTSMRSSPCTKSTACHKSEVWRGELSGISPTSQTCVLSIKTELSSLGNGEWTGYFVLGYSQDTATQVPCLPYEEWQHSACSACFALTRIFNFKCPTGQQAQAAGSHDLHRTFIVLFKGKQIILACVSFVRDHRIHVF